MSLTLVTEDTIGGLYMRQAQQQAQIELEPYYSDYIEGPGRPNGLNKAQKATVYLRQRAAGFLCRDLDLPQYVRLATLFCNIRVGSNHLRSALRLLIGHSPSPSAFEKSA